MTAADAEPDDTQVLPPAPELTDEVWLRVLAHALDPATAPVDVDLLPAEDGPADDPVTSDPAGLLADAPDGLPTDPLDPDPPSGLDGPHDTHDHQDRPGAHDGVPDDLGDHPDW